MGDMTAPRIDTLTPLLAAHLHTGRRVRVWSLIVTVLGDAVELRGGLIATARLSSLLEAMGISQAAQRTALSRLVADGWINRLKDPRDGRATLYQFSDAGRAEFVPAARLVYAVPGEVTRGPWLACASDAPRGIPIAPGVGLWPADFAPRDRGFGVVGDPTDMPEAQRAALISSAHAADLRDLEALLRFLDVSFDPQTGVEAMAARTLFVHRWRRYVLRYPELPESLAPGGWSGLGLRAEVARLYYRITPLSDLWLNAPGTGYDGLPPPSPSYYHRFRDRPGDKK